MKNVFIFISFISLLWGKSVLEIHSINSKEVILKNDTSLQEEDLLQVGQSGFVVSDYLDTEYMSYIVYIVEINSDFIKTKIIKENPFKKDYLAYAKKSIDKEDIVVFNLFKDQAFLIAPNKEEYFKIIKTIKKNFLSPELVVSELSNFSVDKDDLQELSLKYLLGNIYIAYDNKLARLDAFSLKVLEQKDIKLNSDNQDRTFFYHVLTSKISFLLNMLTSFNYDKYYKKLLQE